MKIAVVGAHHATKLLAPYDDGAWAVWSCSPFNESELPRQDAWFELHELGALQDIYLAWLRDLPRVYMRQHYPDIPGSLPYPLEDVLDRFGPYFLTGTLSYMLALALLYRPNEIGLWGISDCPEYAHQRPSLLYFVQRAREQGVTVTAPKHLINQPKLYALEGTS